MTSFNDRIIRQFRDNGGLVEGFGTKLVLIHSTGAHSGAARVNPALALADGPSWLVIASAAGAAKHPAWYHNLVANPDVSIETPRGVRDVTAVELSGEPYAEAWRRFAKASPAFADYQRDAQPRQLPILRLEPR